MSTLYTVYCSKEVAHVAHVADEHLNMESEIQIICRILKLFFDKKKLHWDDPHDLRVTEHYSDPQ